MDDLPIEELRRRVKRMDALLHAALSKSPTLTREIEDMRTEVAVQRIQLRHREAAEALRGLRESA